MGVELGKGVGVGLWELPFFGLHKSSFSSLQGTRGSAFSTAMLATWPTYFSLLVLYVSILPEEELKFSLLVAFSGCESSLRLSFSIISDGLVWKFEIIFWLTLLGVETRL